MVSKGRKERRTHRAGVGHDVGNVLRGVHRFGAVRTLLRNFLVIGHDEREALAVDDMPVECIELNAIAPASDAHFFPLRVRKHSIRTWTQDIASSVRSMSDSGKLGRA